MLVPALLLVLGQVAEGMQLQQPQPFKGRIDQPKLVKRSRPDYPGEAAMAGLAGPVILECHVDTKGRVTEAKVLRGDEPLAEAALKAVRKWRYEPLELDGVPTEFVLTVTVNFKPDGLSLNVTGLLRSLRSQHEAVRASAAAYLGRVRVSATLDSADVTRAVTGLRTLLHDEKSDRVRAAATRALAQLERH